MLHRVISASLSLIMVVSGFSSIAIAQSSSAEKSKEKLSQERLEIREKVRGDISAEKEARVVERCVAAQVKIKAVSDRAEQFNATHTGIYNEWITRTGGFLSRLQASNPDIDSSKLDGDLVSLNGLIEELSTTFNDYRTQLAGLAAMDCVTNPKAFHNSLLAAREYRSAVVTALKTVKSYVQTTIKDDLQAIKDEFVKDSSGEATEEGA